MASVSSPILVGRDAELGRLLQAVETAGLGRPQLVVVPGEAGIGKSRLMAELVARARADDCRILAGGCLDFGEAGVPYLPLAEALRGLARATPPDELEHLLGPTRADLATIAPELGGPTATGVSDATPGTVGQARLFERVLELINRLGDAKPVVIVVEDVQWIDRATRDLITFLVRNTSTERVAAFLTVRTEDLPRGHPNLAWLAELNRAPGGVRIALAPLDRTAVAHQLEAIRGGRPAAGVVDRIWRRSEGNPFYAEELFAAELTGGDAPVTLVEILLGRLRDLDADTHAVAGALAIAGRATDERLIAAVLERTVDSIRPALKAGVERHVLVEEPSGAVRVRHELLREAIERELLTGERRGLHERFARTLTDDPSLGDGGPAAAGELAHHWAAAGRVAEAYEASVAAGHAAEAAHAYADAHREFERARELEISLPPDRLPDAATRYDLRRCASETADLVGAFDRAIELAGEALELARELDDDVAAGLMHGRLGYLRWAAGDAAGGIEEHREAVRLVPNEPATAERARVLGGLASSLMRPGDFEESAAIAREAIDRAVAAGAIPEEARARNVLGFDLVALGQMDVGLVELRRSRELAAQAGPADMLVIAHYNLSLTLCEAGLLEDALAEAVAGRDAARAAGLERRFGFDLGALAGDVLLRLGRWDEADVVTSDALRLDREGRGSAFLSAVRGWLEAARGGSGAERRLTTADELGAGDDPDIGAYVARGRVEIALAAGDLDGALAAAEAGLDPQAESHALFVRTPLVAVGLRAAADLADRARAGRAPEALAQALARADRLRTELERVEAAGLADATRVVAELARVELERVMGSDTPEGWMAVVERLDAIGDRHLGAYARWRAAEAELRARGTRGETERLLSEAIATAETLGAKPLAAQIEALARRARVTLAGPAAGPDDGAAAVDGAAPVVEAPPEDGAAALRRAGLSVREVEVLRLVVAGRTNGQIAERLFITRKTAGVHVTHILDKLGVANRVEAAMVAARLGLEPDEAL